MSPETYIKLTYKQARAMTILGDTDVPFYSNNLLLMQKAILSE